MQLLCIDDNVDSAIVKQIHVGYVYTIRGIVPGIGVNGERQGYLLEELRNGISSSGYKLAYAK